jgi:hypothetical protein
MNAVTKPKQHSDTGKASYVSRKGQPIPWKLSWAGKHIAILGVVIWLYHLTPYSYQIIFSFFDTFRQNKPAPRHDRSRAPL